MVYFDIKKVYVTFKCDFPKWFWWLSHKVAMYFNIYMYTYVDHDYDVDFHVMVMLRSTTGPYGWPVIEVAYGEMILSLHRGCMGDDSSKRVVGVSTWCIAHVWHTRVNTSVGVVYIIFVVCKIYKPMYMYIVFKIYM